MTNIPASVFNKVGVNSPPVPVTPPTILSNQPPMTLGGKSPAMLYYGAEYCPYCAAERWAMTAALSRFGTWSDLKITASSHTDVYPQTNTFSYHGATFTSPYITFSGVEQYTNVPTSSGTSGFTTLQNPDGRGEIDPRPSTAAPSTTPTPPLRGASPSPSWTSTTWPSSPGPATAPASWPASPGPQIAGGLSDPTNPATQAIVATANYITAAICASTKGAPASVCNSPGVQAAAPGP